MDDRRRTISSEEQMIGEALMRVSNTLEAQRLTKSLDYQEKLRSRSNIRLIIAIICLFVAMMMMVISGALLFILWRYADPILDTVMPFLKGMMGDFGVIWDGLVESLSYVPVLVEQLTRLLEQVIIMLEGLNRIDLAGLMGYLSKMLGGLMTMMDDLSAALKPMLASIGRMLETLSLEGLDGIIEDLFGPDAAASIKEFMGGMFSLLAGTGKTLGSLGESLADIDMSAMMKGMQDMLTVGGEALTTLSQSLTDMDLSNLMNGMMDMMDAGGKAMSEMASSLANMDLTEMMEGLENMMNGMGGAMGSFGDALAVVGDTVSQNVENGNIETLINALDKAIGDIGQGISGNIKPEDIQALIQGGGAALNGMGAALERLGADMNAFAEEGIIGIIRQLLGG